MGNLLNFGSDVAQGFCNAVSLAKDMQDSQDVTSTLQIELSADKFKSLELEEKVKKLEADNKGLSSQVGDNNKKVEELSCSVEALNKELEVAARRYGDAACAWP